MSTSHTICSVLILGSGISAWLPAAMLAARLPPNICRISVCDYGDKRDDFIFARPFICRAHDLIGIDDSMLAQKAAARPAYAFTAQTANGEEIQIPFGDYGLSYQGVAFNHYWLRAYRARKARPLSDYNLALRLAKTNRTLNEAPIGLPPIDYGYRLSRQHYIALVKNIAQKAGVAETNNTLKAITTDSSGLITSVTLGDTQHTPDLTLCFDDTRLPAHQHLTSIKASLNGYYIETTASLPGLALHQLQTGTTRLLNFWPGGAFTRTEKTELTRLQHAEFDRIADMESLLRHGPQAAEARPALARKCQVFAARGRIPTEDYEVFSNAEWLTVLNASGLMPLHYDRLVDRHSLDQTIAFVTQISTRIDDFFNQNKQTREAV